MNRWGWLLYLATAGYMAMEVSVRDVGETLSRSAHLLIKAYVGR